MTESFVNCVIRSATLELLEKFNGSSILELGRCCVALRGVIKDAVGRTRLTQAVIEEDDYLHVLPWISPDLLRRMLPGAPGVGGGGAAGATAVPHERLHEAHLRGSLQQ